MVKVEGKVPMIYDENLEYATESFILYFRNKWIKDICDSLSIGYEEMSQINLNLAEMGLEEDINDLKKYESRLLGCDKL